MYGICEEIIERIKQTAAQEIIDEIRRLEKIQAGANSNDPDTRMLHDLMTMFELTPIGVLESWIKITYNL